jgi:hypothetical protein
MENNTPALRTALSLLSIVLLAAASGCEQRPAADGDLGQVTIALTQVPANVACLRITAAGSRTVQSAFAVMPGQPSTLTVTGLPTGQVSFSGEAFSTACASLVMTSVPEWVGGPVTASVTSTSSVSVPLVLRPNGRATVGVDFQGDDAGVSTPACAANGAACATNGGCCSGACVLGMGGTRACQASGATCGGVAAACGTMGAAACCSGLACSTGGACCIPERSTCTSDSQCCFGSCALDAATGFGVCRQATTPPSMCAPTASSCSASGSCCSGNCAVPAGQMIGNCCLSLGAACTSNSPAQCCSGSCTALPSTGAICCIGAGQACSSGRDCCSGTCTVAAGQMIGACQ